MNLRNWRYFKDYFGKKIAQNKYLSTRQYKFRVTAHSTTGGRFPFHVLKD